MENALKRIIFAGFDLFIVLNPLNRSNLVGFIDIFHLKAKPDLFTSENVKK